MYIKIYLLAELPFTKKTVNCESVKGKGKEGPTIP